MEVSRRPNRRQLWTLEILRVWVGEWNTKALFGRQAFETNCKGFPKRPGLVEQKQKVSGLMLG